MGNSQIYVDNNRLMLKPGLWPPHKPRTTESHAELAVYEALAKQLPQGWYAWHSLRIRVPGHSDAEAALDVWYRVAKSSLWANLQDVRRVYPHADAIGKWTVFNIRGNRYRLIVEIGYRSRIVFIRHILTHSEYGRGEWKR